MRKTVASPSVYLYKESAKGFELYLGDYSTIDGLSCFDWQTKAQVVNFGASSYKNFGWATENEIPELITVSEIIEFLKSEGEIGLIDIEIKLQNIGSLSTHDDSECHFVVSEKNQILNILKTVASPEFTSLIFNKITENPDFYITFGESGKINKYGTFDDYLNSKK